MPPLSKSAEEGTCLLQGSGPGAWERSFRRPVGLIRAKEGVTELSLGGATRRITEADPFQVLAGLLGDRPGLTAAGYWGYDLRYALERLPRIAADDLGLPDCWLGLYDEAGIHCGPEPATQPPCIEAESVEIPALGSKRYAAGVRRILEYIAAGDCYQVNLSHRISARCSIDGYEVYRRLAAASPAPFSAYIHCGDHEIASSSPGLFLKVRDGWAETRPIKGTRPRGETPEEDRRIMAELMASPKDRAELVMIVDLERNDLGRVCEYGTVSVPELLRPESFAQVHHLVATVRGRLRREVGPLECLRALFPGGSITGAPKIRAMEIIEELEPVRRGPYTGAIGWVDGRGNGEWNIAIRTIVLKGGAAHLHVGAGIVADSDPDSEWAETLVKASGMLRALGG